MPIIMVARPGASQMPRLPVGNLAGYARAVTADPVVQDAPGLSADPESQVPAYALPEPLVARLLRHAVVGPNAERHVTVSPFTNGPAASLPISTEADVTSAFAMARKAQRGWADRSPRERARVLLRFHDLVLERQVQGLDIAQTETGKARRDAFEELLDCALTSRQIGRAHV